MNPDMYPKVMTDSIQIPDLRMSILQFSFQARFIVKMSVLGVQTEQT